MAWTEEGVDESVATPAIMALLCTYLRTNNFTDGAAVAAVLLRDGVCRGCHGYGGRVGIGRVGRVSTGRVSFGIDTADTMSVLAKACG
jgi:hypothetical protein